MAGADHQFERLVLGGAARWNTLLRRIEDPHEFYSYARWPSMEKITAMRAHPNSPETIGELTARCEETELDTYLMETAVDYAPQPP